MNCFSSSVLKLREECLFSQDDVILLKKVIELVSFSLSCCALVFFKYQAFSILQHWRNSIFLYMRLSYQIFTAVFIDVDGPGCWHPLDRDVQFSLAIWKPVRLLQSQLCHFSLGQANELDFYSWLISYVSYFSILKAKRTFFFSSLVCSNVDEILIKGNPLVEY